jgi:hypothetical protein
MLPQNIGPVTGVIVIAAKTEVQANQLVERLVRHTPRDPGGFGHICRIIAQRAVDLRVGVEPTPGFQRRVQADLG